MMAVLTMVSLANANRVTFEDLTLPSESYWNGSDESGGFASGNAYFGNNYNSAWETWDGFSYSNVTDTATSGLAGQYNSIVGGGQGSSANYAVCYVGWAELPAVTLDTADVLAGLYVTNDNCAYYSMLNGDAFAKKFGGKSGGDPDWLLLTITGKDSSGDVTGTVEFYLADFRFEDNSQDYIVDTWEFVDLTSLGSVKSLEFSLSSSDAGVWGMNTPAYFALDTIVRESQVPDVGPYTETGINGYVGDDGRHAAATDGDAAINPIFRGWATGVVSYQPAPGVDLQWTDPNKALGRATGDNVSGIVSLGDLGRDQIDAGTPPGQITVSFSEPIRDGNGYDFAVFENGLVSLKDTAAGSIAGQMFAELGYVEVSSNGKDFVRFPSVSLTPGLVGAYGTIEISRVYNLAGKHPNANGICTGTPFDLREIADEPDVVAGVVDINNINYVRIVDIPGSGDFGDEATTQVDAASWPYWGDYVKNHAIYDAWVTLGSGGVDLEAIGVLEEQEYSADINLDGVVDMFDFALLASAWRGHFGSANWIGRCDLAERGDYIIDTFDFAVLGAQWLEVEKWRNK
jgi:hypothetical protein